MRRSRRIAILVTAILALAVALLLASLFVGCNVGLWPSGSYTLSFVWDGTLRQIDVMRERYDQKLPAGVRERVVVLHEAKPLIAEQLRRANLTKARGVLRLGLPSPPPYTSFLLDFQIVNPSFSDLDAAVEQEDIARITELISRDHNVNQRELLGESTVLYQAAAGRKLRSMQALLKLGADPNIPDLWGGTPLRIAVLADSKASVELLIGAGAKIDHADENGVTPLMMAADMDRVAILELLLQAGANPNLKAANGKTAVMFARDAGHTQAVAILERQIHSAKWPHDCCKQMR
jgi:Ankyrin repeats (3 copies)